MRDINAHCRPDYGGQIAALSYRVQSVEARFAPIEAGQAGYNARLSALEASGANWADITNKPTTLAGYGITNAQPLDSDLTSLAAASTVGALYYRSAAGTWAPVTIGSNISFTAGTLSAVSSGGGGSTSVGASSGTPVSVTGTTAETVLATIAIPAGAIGPNGFVEIVPLFSWTSSANGKTLRVRLGGQEMWAVTQTANIGAKAYLTVNNAGTATAQRGSPASLNGLGALSAVQPPSGTVNTAAATVLTITAQLASAADTATLENYLVRITYGA